MATAAALAAWPAVASTVPVTDCHARFDSRTVHWIVPYAVGGGYSNYSRLVAPLMEATLGTTIVVENRVGAGGLVGSRAISTAKPDGHTIGIVSATGLVVTDMIGMTGAPDIVNDFSLVGQISTTRHVWASGKRHGFGSIDEALQAGAANGLVAGLRDVAESSYLDFVIGTAILGIEGNPVVGYEGTPDEAMAAIRGEVDLVVGNFESLLTWLERGDLRPLLQISDRRISPHPVLDGVPVFAGQGGIAEQWALTEGRNVDEARDDAGALAALLAGARIVVAPVGIPQESLQCLRLALDDALQSPELLSLARSANLFLDPAPADVVQADLAMLASRVDRFAPMLRAAVERARR